MGNRHAETQPLVNPRFSPCRDVSLFEGRLTYLPSFNPNVDLRFFDSAGRLLLELHRSILPPLRGHSLDSPPPEFSIPGETARFIAELVGPNNSPIREAIGRYGRPALIRFEHGSAWGIDVAVKFMEALFHEELVPRFPVVVAARGRNKRCSIHEVAIPDSARCSN